MTRYTFVLLVCRTIGILGIITLLGEIGSPYTAMIGQLVWSQVATAKGVSFEGVSSLGVALSIGLPIAASIIGLVARSIAKRFSDQVAARPFVLPLVFSAVICWFAVDELCIDLYRIGAIRWSQSRILGADVDRNEFAKGILGLYPGDIVRNCERIGMFLTAIAIVSLMALRNSGGLQQP